MNIRNLIAKRDSFTIPGLQTETGADYGTVKKCVDELFAEGVLSEPVGLTYFKLKQPRKDKRRTHTPTWTRRLLSPAFPLRCRLFTESRRKAVSKSISTACFPTTEF